MNTKIFIKTIALMVMIISMPVSVLSADNNSRQSSSNTITCDVTATLYHADTNPVLKGFLKGTLNCDLITSNNGGYSLTFRTEAGSEPSGLGMMLVAPDKKNFVCTSEFSFILVSPNTNADILYNWISLKKNRQNPSLTVELNAQSSTQPDMPAGYTNPKQIKAKAFVIDNRQDKPAIYHYADITIPAQSLYLSQAASMSDAMDSNGIKITCASISFANIQKNMLKRLIGKVQIKGSSCSAVCTDFTAVEQISEESFLSSVSALRIALTDLYASPNINVSSVRRLIRGMEKTIELQRSAEPLQAVSQAIEVGKTAENMAQAGGIPADILPLLTAHTSGMLKNLVKANTSVCDMRFTMAPPVFSPVSATWYVNQSVGYPASGGVSVPDGSIEYPFESIAQALQFARDISLVNITLYVFSGYYGEPLLIDRNTTLMAVAGGMTIIGGPILNLSESSLIINGFYLVHSEAPGAVFVSNPNAVTSISNTVVQDALRFGIYQHGGDLTLNNVQVYRTQSESGLQLFGTGICLRGAVQAVFTDVISSNNASYGLVAEDSDTSLVAAVLVVNNSILNRHYSATYTADPTVALYFAGIAVRHNATADISVLRMAGNEGAGIIAYAGGTVRLTDATINDTVAYTPPGGWTGSIRYGGGSALWARSGGYISATNFLLTRSDLTGGMIGTGGAMDFSYGEVSYNSIGIAILDDSFDYRRLTDHVRYRENGTDLQASTLPIPDTGI